MKARTGAGRFPISTEVELKLAARAADLPELTRTLAVLADGGAAGRRRSLVSTYYDTPELALQARGLTLRVRAEEGGFTQTLKAGGLAGADLLSRGEWEDSIAENRPDPNAPQSGVRLPPGIASELRPLFITEVARFSVEIAFAPASRIEAAVDEGWIRAVAGGRPQPISEVELELKCGSPAALYDLALRLLAAAPLRIGTSSKSERGYRLIAGAGPAAGAGVVEGVGPLGRGGRSRAAVHAGPVALDAGMTVEDALQSIGRSCLVHLLRNEAAAVSRQPEGLHQMRVAVRRLRSLVAAVKRMLPREERRRIAGELAALARPLGPARNLDVFAAELLRPVRAALPGEPGWDALAATAERARRAAYDRVVAGLLAPRHTAAILRLLRWFEGRGWRCGEGAEPPAQLGSAIGRIAPGILDRRRRAVRKRAKGFARLSPHQRHRLRIAVKQLRYSVELFASLYDPRRLEGFVKQLKRVQDDLGRANDVRAARSLAAELGRAAKDKAAVAQAGARLVEWHEGALARRENKMRKHLRRLNRAPPFWRD